VYGLHTLHDGTELDTKTPWLDGLTGVFLLVGYYGSVVLQPSHGYPDADTINLAQDYDRAGR